MSQQIRRRIPHGTICTYCDVNYATSWDHIIPSTKGGSDNIENLTPACRSCNSFASNILFSSLADKKGYIQYRRLATKRASKEAYRDVIIVNTKQILAQPVEIIKPKVNIINVRLILRKFPNGMAEAWLERL